MTYTGVRRKPTTVPALNVGGHYRRQAVPQARTARPSHDVSRRRSRPCRGSRSGCSGSRVPQACLLTMYLSQPAAVSFHSEQQDYARGAISCERELIGSPIQGRRQPDARSHLHSPGCEPHLPQCPCDWWCSACERTSIAIAIGQVMGDQALSAAIHIQAHTDGAVPAFVQAPAVRLACTGSACRWALPERTGAQQVITGRVVVGPLARYGGRGNLSCWYWALAIQTRHGLLAEPASAAGLCSCEQHQGACSIHSSAASTASL